MLEVIQIFLNHVRQEGELGLPEVGDAGDPAVFQVRRGVLFCFPDFPCCCGGSVLLLLWLLYVFSVIADVVVVVVVDVAVVGLLWFPSPGCCRC